MTSFASKYNSGSQFDVDTEGYSYVSLSWLHSKYPNNVFRVYAMYINTKGNYDPQPTFVINRALVNIPAHCTTTVDMILHDAESVEAIKRGEVGFRVYTYQSKNPKAKKQQVCYSIRYVDIKAADATTIVIPE